MQILFDHVVSELRLLLCAGMSGNHGAVFQ